MMNIIIGPIFRAMGLGSWRSAAAGCDNIQKAKNRACLRINITVHLECHGPDARRPEEQAYCVTAGPIGSNYSVPTYLPPPPPIFRSASTTESFFTRESSGPAGALSHLLPVSEGSVSIDFCSKECSLPSSRGVSYPCACAWWWTETIPHLTFVSGGGLRRAAEATAQRGRNGAALKQGGGHFNLLLRLRLRLRRHLQLRRHLRLR